ncbi:hypothetical protein EDM68_01355 [Candidatus Uhrbacteria bacterium]|nr:MAG: hypothetical protein EDM68_01355 [Candidatus Uhrbacteria bacterium]
MLKKLVGRAYAAINAVTDRALLLVAPVRADERIEIEFAAPAPSLKLAEPVETPKPVEKPSPALVALTSEAELAAARKRCEHARANFERLVRKHSGKGARRKGSLKGLSLEELRRLEADFNKGALALAKHTPPTMAETPSTGLGAVLLEKLEATATESASAEVIETKAEESVAEAAPTEVVETKKLEAVKKAPPPEYGSARRLLASEYKGLLQELAKLRKVKDLRELAHFHPEPIRVRKRNLRGLISRVRAEIDQVKAEQAAAAERKKREAENREAALLQEYNAARAKGASLPPFNRWKRQQLLRDLAATA